MNEEYDDRYTKFQNTVLLLSRLVVALVFLFAGIAKWSFLSTAPAGFSGGMLLLIKFLSIVEPLGAIALAFGFLTRWASAGFAIIMIGAIILLRFTMNVSFLTMPQVIGFDYNTLILANSVLLMAFGGGKWSIDGVLNRKKLSE